jgi:hypothetical protein
MAQRAALLGDHQLGEAVVGVCKRKQSTAQQGAPSDAAHTHTRETKGRFPAFMTNITAH